MAPLRRTKNAPCSLVQVIADSDDEGEGGADAGADEPPPKRRREIVASLFSKYSKPQHLMFGLVERE